MPGADTSDLAAAPAAIGPVDPSSMRAPLLAWYRRARRDLPWRRTRDPYRIWVSEILLQQTRVDVVVPFYERFVAQFPDVAALAAAPQDAVLRAWAGLGYYARARNLHAAAQQIVATHAGRFPRTATELRRLPGIGPYTAGAIGSIAFDAPAPILDGNVVRVFARWFAFDGDVDRPALRRQLWSVAVQWAAGDHPGDANQALMELGAVICIKPVPRCDICPVAMGCAARRTGRERELPRARGRPASRQVRLEAGVVVRRGRLLLVRRTGGKLLQDWWELPSCEARPASQRGGAQAGSHLARALRARFALETATPKRVGVVRHSILEHRIEAVLFELEALPAGRAGRGGRTGPAGRAGREPSTAQPRPRREPERGAIASLESDSIEMCWVALDGIDAWPLSTLARKALRIRARGVPESGA